MEGRLRERGVWAQSKEEQVGRGRIVAHLQHVSPSGDRAATLDATGSKIVVSDDAGTILRRLPIPEIEDVRGFRWLSSEAGFAVWSDDRVYTVDIDDRRRPLIAFRIEHSKGSPYSLHGIRALPQGLLITAESCARKRGRVGLHAYVVHLDGVTPHSQTPLEPWAGAVLYDAFALTDGRIVLSLSEQEYFDAMTLRCYGDLGRKDGYVDDRAFDRELVCRVIVNQRSLGASMFRVVEVSAPARVRVLGEHTCPDDGGCWPQNWAPSSEELIWGTASSARRLRSPLETDPLFPTSGVWSEVSLDPDAGRAKLHSLWLHDGHLLTAAPDRVSWAGLESGVRWNWSPRLGSVESARVSADGESAIVTSPKRVLLFDLATGRRKRVLRLRDVGARFGDSVDESAFSDASLTRGGALMVDVAGFTPLRWSSHVGTAPGLAHEGCDSLPRPDRNARREWVAEARALAPWFRERTRPSLIH